MMEGFDMEAAVGQLSEEMGWETPEEPTPGEEISSDIEPETPSEEVPAPKEAPTEPPADVPAEPPAEAVAAPKTWRAEAAAEFGKLPSVVQQEILKRESDIFSGIEQYKAEADYGKGFRTALAPYAQTLERYGIDPHAQVAELFETQFRLAFGTPQEKMQVLQGLVNDFGINAEALAEAPPVDPTVMRLQNELRQLQSSLSQQQSMQQEARRSQIEQEVHAFASDPKNVYFEELAEDIAHLLKTKTESSIQAAYETALWRNPAVRAKEMLRIQNEQAEATKKASAERVAKAKATAAVGVRTSAKSGSATTALGSMDDTLAAAYAEIKNRS